MYFFYYVPTGLDVRRRRAPTITWFLAGMCVTLFILSHYAPARGAWNLANLIFFPSDPMLATSLSHAFLHVSWWHLIGNLVYLVVFGRALEDRFGPARFFAVFALSAMAGAWTHVLLSSLFDPAYLDYGVIGASGATSGLLGAFLVRFYYARISVAYWVFMPLQGVNRAGTQYVPALVGVACWFIYQGVFALIQFGSSGVGVAYSVHVGGFAAGALLAVIFGAAPRARAERLLAGARRAVSGADFFAAQALVLDYLELRPGDWFGRLLAARAFLSTGHRSAASAQFASAVTLLLGDGRRGEAEDAMAEAMRAVPGFSLAERAQIDMACGLERSMKYRASLDAYRNFAARYPESTETPFVLLRAASLLERRLDRPEKALECYGLLVERFPDDCWADYARSEIERLRWSAAESGARAAGQGRGRGGEIS
ncbi:MAG: rhomboid family intramembrane serine protease [Candidatus Krumholzibacteria bacterium]|nr:rhomboid family intramembrane serine protease [Candidatus Krumholzibacteria bacterium]